MSRTFGLLLASSLMLAILASVPVQAGTQAAPEITDPATDQILTTPKVGECIPATPAGGATCVLSSGSDVLVAWVSENATHVLFFIQTTGACPGTVTTYTYIFNFHTNGTDYKASAVCSPFSDPASGTPAGSHPIPSPVSGTGLLTPGDAATIASLNDTVLELAVPRVAIGSPAVGAGLTNLFVTTSGQLVGDMVPFVSDRAPDGTAFGTPYNLTMGSASTTEPGTGGGTGNPNGAIGCTYKAGETNKSDSDADCLPDYWELKYFPTIVGQNGTQDPDGDGCNNRCEYLHGTDPTKADTDGDGFTDGAEVTAGTDPTSASSHPSTGTTTTTTTTPTTSSSTSSSPPIGTGAPVGPSSALDKLKANEGYVVASGAAMGAVVLISLVGLFGRWGA